MQRKRKAWGILPAEGLGLLVIGVMSPDRASAMHGISSDCNYLNPMEVCATIEYEVCLELCPGEITCTTNRDEFRGERRET